MKEIILLFIGAYVAGSVNFAILLHRVLGKEDPRTGYSRNPGVTNVYRHLGWSWAGVVLLLDLARAVAVALVSRDLVQMEIVPWAGLGLVLGNRFPCFHGLRGGKGVANYLGFTAVTAPVAAGVSVLAWISAYALFRIPFIGSFAMVILLAAGTVDACGYDPRAAAGVLITAGLIFHNHKRNMSELMKRRKG